MTITYRAALELISHEAVVRRAYKDSKGVWTWSVGITSASGHNVERYIDNPQPMRRCLEVFVWALEKYAQDVREAFAGRDLTEEQFAAALSFHYNTGAIKRASWVKKFLAGDIAGARAAFMQWNKPSEIVGRRRKERDLFFDGVWSSDGKVTEYVALSPSRYTPIWSSAVRVDIEQDLKELMGLTEKPEPVVPVAAPVEVPVEATPAEPKTSLLVRIVLAIFRALLRKS